MVTVVIRMNKLIRLDTLAHGPSDYARDVFDGDRLLWLRKRFPKASDLQCLVAMYQRPRMAGGSGTFSGYTQTHVLDHVNGKTSWTMPASVYLALCTATPDSTKTGSTITEISYTGPYARIAVTGAFSAAAAGTAGNPATTANTGTVTFANCTSGSATILGWALCDALTVGNMLHWGSTASTAISTTQTPPTVAIGGLTQALT
jgi:hypothetical protein